MSADKATLTYLANLLEQRTGQQIAPSRTWRVDTVLKPLLKARGLGSLAALVDVMEARPDPALAGEVVEALLNNETFFFRDAAVFEQLRGNVLDELRAARANSRRLAIWCAGCSTGQEAYSLAMIFAGDPARWANWTIDITATDVSEAALVKGKAGFYSQFEIQRGLPVTAMLRWFDQVGQDWRVKRDLARLVRFRRHNLLMAQTGRFDLVLCRNVLLYFSPERRREAFDRLAASIVPDGYLVLGAGETVIGQTEAFVPAPNARGLYRPAIQAQRQVA